MPIFIDPSLSQYIRAPSSSPVRVANPDAFLGYSSPARIQTSRPLFLSPHLSFHSLQHNSPPKTPSTTPQLTFLTPPQPVFCSSSYTSSPYWNYDSYSSWGADYTLFSPTPTQAPFLHAALQSPSPLRSAALPHVAHSTFPCLTPSAASQARSPFLSATGSACLVSDASPAELRSPSLGRPHLRRDHYSHRTPSPTPLDEDSPFIHFPQTPLQHRLARAALNTESPLTPMSTPPSTPLPFKSKLRDRAAASQLASSATPSSTHSPPSHTPIHAPPNGQHDGTAVIITERNGFAIPSATRRSTRSQARAVRVPASDGALLPISLSSQHAERALSTSDNISSSPLISKKRRYSQQSGPNKTRRAPASRTSGRGAVSSQASTASQGPPLEFKKRTFPDNLERRPQFPRFYRNFPVCSFISNDRSQCVLYHFVIIVSAHSIRFTSVTFVAKPSNRRECLTHRVTSSIFINRASPKASARTRRQCVRYARRLLIEEARVRRCGLPQNKAHIST